MSLSLRELVEQIFSAIEAKDLTAVIDLFAEGGILIDPHYPQPRMEGQAAIAKGLRWGLYQMKSMRFLIVHYCVSDDGQVAIVEVDTHHVLKVGMKLDFPQVFVVEVRNGLIIRLQAYEPFGPGGIGGLIIGCTRLWWKLRAAFEQNRNQIEEKEHDRT